MIILILLGILLRVAALFFNKNIYDPETTNWFITANYSFKDLFTGNYYDFAFHNFLYIIILKFWSTFSLQPYWLRIPSVIFSILQIPIIYKLAERLFNKETALISTLLFSFSSYHLFWSSQVRVYPLLMLFQLLYLYIFLIAVDNKQIRWWILLGLIGFIGFITEYAFIWLYLPLNLWFLLKVIFRKNIDKPTLLSWIISNMITIDLFGPHLSKFIYVNLANPEFSILNTSHFFANNLPNLKYLISVISMYFFRTTQPLENNLLNINYSTPLFLILLYGSLKLSKSNRSLAIFITFLPVVSALLIGKMGYMVFIDYQVMIASVGIYLILGYVLSRKKLLLALILPAWLIINFYEYNSYLHSPDEADWVAKTKFISENLNYNDTMIFIPNYINQSYQYYTKLNSFPQNEQPHIIDYEYDKNPEKLKYDIEDWEVEDNKLCLIVGYFWPFNSKVLEYLNQNKNFSHYQFNQHGIYCLKSPQ